MKKSRFEWILKNSLVIKVIIFRYILTIRIIFIVTIRNFYYFWKNLQNFSLTYQNIYANIETSTKEINKLHSKNCGRKIKKIELIIFSDIWL